MSNSDEELPIEEAPALDQPPTPPQQDVIVISIDRRPDGSSAIEIGTQGDVRITEVETFIKMALRRWQAQTGL